MKEKIGNLLSKLFIIIAIFSMVMLLLLQHLFVMPYGAGKLISYISGMVGKESLCFIVIDLIPIMVIVFFFSMMIASMQEFLFQIKRLTFEKSILCLFFGLLFIVMGDNRNIRITYDLLHKLLHVKTIALIFVVCICIYGCARIYHRSRYRIAKYALMVFVLCIPLVVAMLLCGLKEGVIWTAWTYAYYIAVLFLTGFVLKQNNQKRILAIWGSVLIICICGQSLLSHPGFHLQKNRNSQLADLFEMYDTIQQREGTTDVPIYGNNRGIELLLSYNENITLPYLPEDMVRGRKARLYAPEEMIYLYEAGNNGEDGLGLLTNYVQGNGYRYVLIVPKDYEEYAMVENGGYEMVYKTDSFQLYYK